MPSILRRSSRPALLVLGALLSAAPSFALEPDEIALVVNSRVPESRALAELYTKERHIPDGRIIEISLDPGSTISPAEEMPFDAYEGSVAAPVRSFLEGHDLKDRVRCLVTFWGMPIRIGRKAQTEAGKRESEAIGKELNDARASIAKDLAALEQSAAELDPSFKPQAGEELPRLARRLDVALGVIARSLPTIKERASRDARYAQLATAAERLVGADRATQLMSQPGVALFSPRPPGPQEVATAQSRVAEIEAQIARTQSDTATADDRRKARALARDNLGQVGLAFLATAQLQAISVDQTESALDSELSLLWWRDYPRARWVQNPLEWKTQLALRQRHAVPPPALMVTRLDGPSEQIVRNLILTAGKVESEGLKGIVAIDARGNTENNGYGQFDQRLRDLAGFLGKKGNLKIAFDNTEALFPPHSLQDIALYCGWYSLRNYSSPGSFSPGAVGYHVASFELLSLRRPNEHGWVRGLLSEGVVGTLGPVSEPYLESFPPPNEFFPLLLTGRMTLAEVYWRTVPWSSWMQTCIGDPLYNPYKLHPPLDAKDLPEPLRSALDLQSGRPAASQPVP